MKDSAGRKFKEAIQSETPLQVVGAINANHALLAEQSGFKAIYLSGGGVAAGSLGIPDLGITTLEDVLIDVQRITNVCSLPLLVDIDTGFGPSAFNIARTIKSLEKAGAAGIHIRKTKSVPNAVAIDPAKNWSLQKKWSTESKPQSMHAQTLISRLVPGQMP